MLKLGIKIPSGGVPINAIKQAKKSGAVFYVDARKAQNNAPGKNSPVTTTLTDLTGKGNNVTISNMGGTATDGYVVYNGKNYIRTDGTNTAGAITTNAEFDITTQDFGFCWGGIVSAANCFLFCKGLSSSDDVQYGFRVESDMSLSVYFNGYTNMFSTDSNVVPLNQFARIEVTRIKGVLKVFINDALVKMRADTTTLTSRSLIRLFCRPNNGTFTNGYHAYFAFFTGANLTEENITKFADLASKEYYTPAIHRYYVSTTGNDANNGSFESPFATLQKASDVSKCGDTIYIRGGTYSQRPILSKSGRASRPITIRNYPGETPIFDGTSITWGSPWGCLFNLGSQHWLNIIGIKVINSAWAGIGSVPDDNGCRNITIKDCITYNTKASGIAVYNGKNITIDGNSIEQACTDTSGSQEAISLASVDGFTIKNNHVFNLTNAVLGAGGEGIDVKDGTSNGKIFNNTVNDVAKIGIYVDAYAKASANIEVFENNVYNCEQGITVAVEKSGSLTNVSIYENTLDNCGWGMTVGGWSEGFTHAMEDITFDNNHVTNSVLVSMYLGNDEVTNVDITNNHLNGIVTSIPIYLVEGVTVSKYTIDNNAINRVVGGHPTGTNYTLIGG